MGKALVVWSLQDLIDVIEGCVKNKFDCVIFVEGKRGLGKSTIVYKICSRLKIPQPFKPRRDIVYSRDDTLKHLATKQGGIIFSDEMINVAYNRDFYQEEQKTLLKALNMYRDSCNVFIGCIPSFIELDKQIQRLCKIRICVVRRGVALIHTQMSSMYQSDSWDIKANMKIESAWTNKGFRNPRWAQLTTCRGILRFNDLTPEQRIEYEEIKKERRGKVFGQYQDMTLLGNPEKLFYDKLLIAIKGGKISPQSFRTLADINGKQPEQMQRKINLMLKELGDEKRFRDYCIDEKRKVKRDNLGFNIGYEPKPAVQEQEQAPDITPELPNQSQEQVNGGDNKEDVFGFQT